MNHQGIVMEDPDPDILKGCLQDYTRNNQDTADRLPVFRQDKKGDNSCMIAGLFFFKDLPYPDQFRKDQLIGGHLRPDRYCTTGSVTRCITCPYKSAD